MIGYNGMCGIMAGGILWQVVYNGGGVSCGGVLWRVGYHMGVWN